MKEKAAVERELNGMVELEKDNTSLKVIFLFYYIDCMIRACSVMLVNWGYLFKDPFSIVGFSVSSNYLGFQFD